MRPVGREEGFTWCISLSERKEKHAFKFILTTIKTQMLLATGDNFPLPES